MAKKRGRPRLNPGERKDAPRQVRMPKELDDRVQKACDAEGITVSELVRQLLTKWLEGRR